jgi:hypothetical protein
VHPIVFGAYGEVSEGMEVLIGKLADAWAPQIADQYLLDNVLAAEGIARSILRKEIGAACFNAHAHILLGRTKFCQPGYGAAYGRGAETKMSGSIKLGRRNKRHGAPGGTGYLVACPLAGAAFSWLGWVTARRRGRMSRIVPTASAGPSELLPPTSLVV